MEAKVSKPFGGLNRRARKAQRRNRATRIHHNELVDEYFSENEEEMNFQRNIPIRHKSDFFPSAHYVDQKTLTTGQQLELPLNSGRKVTKNNTTSKLIPHHLAIKITKNQDSKPSSTSSRLRKFKDAKAWQPVHLSPRILMNRSLWHRRFSSLSLSGFGYGCLLGGAAAAFMLMVLDIIMTQTL